MKVENLNMADVVSRIDSQIKLKKTSRQAVADACGFASVGFCDWVRRNSIPSALTLFNICEFLDANMEWILTGSIKYELSHNECLAFENDALDFFQNNKFDPLDLELLNLFKECSPDMKRTVKEFLKANIKVNKKAGEN